MNTLPFQNPPAPRRSSRAFSLVEVLLAIFILGIGMIMVASVFPVGANWTRQTTEESVGQTVAQAAFSVIQTHYGTNGDLHNLGFMAPDLSPASRNTILANGLNTDLAFYLQAFPGFLPNSVLTSPGIPPSERAYQFGNHTPFPAADPRVCTYFWTALVRLNADHKLFLPNGNLIVNPSPSYKYDVYILVFRKGAVEHRFNTTNNPPLPPGFTFKEIFGTRDLNNWLPNFDPALMPSVGIVDYGPGTYDANGTPTVSNALPPMGQTGIGVLSGTVFRQVINPITLKSAMPRPLLYNQVFDPTGVIQRRNPSAIPPDERIIYSPAADGTNPSASPLIYIYQTTLSF